MASVTRTGQEAEGRDLNGQNLKTRKGGNSLLTKIIKWSAIAALREGGFWYSISSCRPLSQFAVAAGTVVLTRAARMRRYVWMTLLLLAVCPFNPVASSPFSNYITGIASAFTVLLFFFSLELLQPKRRLSIVSITDRMPGSESL